MESIDKQINFALFNIFCTLSVHNVQKNKGPGIDTQTFFVTITNISVLYPLY